MILYIKAVEETSSHVNHRMTVVSSKTAGVYDISPSCMHQPVNATFTTPPILKPVVVLENASSPQLTGNQVNIFTQMFSLFKIDWLK